jgi:hypothetical protein
MHHSSTYLPGQRKKIITFPVIFTLLFLFVNRQGLTQNTGYLGKKFMLKTNVVNGIRIGFNNCELEYVIDRRLSLTGEFEIFKYSRGDKGVDVKTGKIKPGSRQLEENKEISTLKNGTTKGLIGRIGCKLYFDKVLPAPIGFYASFGIGFGSASMKDYRVSYEYKKSPNSFGHDEGVQRPDVTDLNGTTKILFFEMPSFGCQAVYHKLVMLDGKISVQSQYCPMPGNLRNAFEHNYFVRSNTLTYARNNLSVGLAIYLKVGFLIF